MDADAVILLIQPLPATLAGTALSEIGERPPGTWYAQDGDDLVCRNCDGEPLFSISPTDLVGIQSIEIRWTDGTPSATWKNAVRC